MAAELVVNAFELSASNVLLVRVRPALVEFMPVSQTVGIHAHGLGEVLNWDHSTSSDRIWGRNLD
jgi:hypothetical protein